jgi:hypothetical protein
MHRGKSVFRSLLLLWRSDGRFKII